MTASRPVRGFGGSVLDGVCGAVIAVVRFCSRHRLPVSALSLVVTLVVGMAYLIFGSLGVDPAAAQYMVRVHFDRSGGLLPGQSVTLRGVPIGVVDSVELTERGLVATASIDSATRVPTGGEVRVAGLSLAGEQYLDFRPKHDDGPYLSDGAEIAAEHTTTPVPLWQTLSQMDKTLEQIEPGEMTAIVDELGMGPQGPEKLDDVFSGGLFLISTLHSVLPETSQLLRESGTVLNTVRDVGPGLGEFADNTRSLLAGVDAKSAGYAHLLDTAPGTLASVDAVIQQNSVNARDMLGNLNVVSEMATKRIPAFEEFFFPTHRDGSTLGGIAHAMHDGGIWGLVNLYPRYACDYPLPRQAPTLPNFPEPFLYTQCPNPDPSVLIRGADNAPRPPGEAVPGKPAPGESPQTRADPTPMGPQSIPLPFAGPELPAPPPP